MTHKCPFKPITTNYVSGGAKVYGSHPVAEIKIDFNNCDGFECMAYDKNTCECKRLRSDVEVVK